MKKWNHRVDTVTAHLAALFLLQSDPGVCKSDFTGHLGLAAQHLMLLSRNLFSCSHSQVQTFFFNQKDAVSRPLLESRQTLITLPYFYV